MDSAAWSRFAAASKRHQSSSANHHSRYDPYQGFAEMIDGGDEDSRAELSCPFCSEDFDIIGLCFHIDDKHPAEAKNGVCPICSAKVGMDMVGHITMQHGYFFKMQRRRRFRRGSSGAHSSSTLSLLRKEFEVQSLLAGSSYIESSTAAPDPLLSSLIYTLPFSEPSKGAHAESLSESSLISNGADEKVNESRPSVGVPLSDKDKEERAQRREFVQGLLLSTIFQDAL